VAIAPSSSVQRARQQLAARLRDIRLDAGLTARSLSAAAGWHEAKTSRIESAKQAPSEADILQWCRVCGADRDIPDLIAASRAADSMYVEWRRLNPADLRRAQESRRLLYQRTQFFKGVLLGNRSRVPSDARLRGRLLSAIGVFRDTPDDVEEAVAARMSRNRMLRNGNHRFVLLMEESVLRYRLGAADVMADQLSYLLEAAELPSLSLGVIPFTAQRGPLWPLESFTVFDDERVHVELLSAQVTVTAPSEITLYVRAFERLAELAVYRTQARALITAAVDALG
jgi:transcriptional regulator with XRE-family HTH domain